jgi:hypothetical protein
MSAFTFVTPCCCGAPSVINMDSRSRQIVNRMCLHCGAHWYGEDGSNVVEFTRAAWDRWMNSAEQVAA